MQQSLKDYAQTVREHERNLPEQLLQALQGTEEVSTAELRDLFVRLQEQERCLGIAIDQPWCDGEQPTFLSRVDCYATVNILERFHASARAHRLKLLLDTLNLWLHRKHFQTDSMCQLNCMSWIATVSYGSPSHWTSSLLRTTTGLPTGC